MLNGLSADLEEFVEQELAAGKYASREELVAEAVRLLRERERCVKELREEILPALEHLNGDPAPFDHLNPQIIATEQAHTDEWVAVGGINFHHSRLIIPEKRGRIHVE
jgi:putative addiction module CopG family antidote